MSVDLDFKTTLMLRDFNYLLPSHMRHSWKDTGRMFQQEGRHRSV